jgi:hypothetical protein
MLESVSVYFDSFTAYLERPNGLEQRKMVIFDKLTWRES